jgi:serine/threonine-protein kinase RsbW
VHDALDRFLGRARPDEDAAALFRMGVVEIASNLVRYACDDVPGCRVSMCLSLDANTLRATFEDNGNPLREPSEIALPDDLSERGRGLVIALSALDELHYQRTEGRNHWLLVKSTRKG